MTNANIQRASQPRKPSKNRAESLLASVCVELGFTPEDAALIDAGEQFVSPSGLVCRLKKDELEPHGALRPELELPLLLDDLESPQLALLLDLQTVFISTMGWTVSADPEQGQLFLSALVASTTAPKVVDDLVSGSVLALSALQMLITGIAEIPETPEAGLAEP